MLLAALKLMKERYAFDGELVLTGVAMQSHGEVLRERQRLGLEDVVRVLGSVPYADLPGLYNLARMMIFPSLFEGFGIPLVEAMACGCPIACSDVTSIPEVVDDAGVFFVPTSAEDIAEKSWRLWTDESLRREKFAVGRERASVLTWQRTAQETIRVYSKALGQKGGD